MSVSQMRAEDRLDGANNWSPWKTRITFVLEDLELWDMLSPILGITKEIMSQGPQVLDMECREPDDLSMAPEGPSFLQCSPSISTAWS
jgi:hypothetical protein